MTVYGTVRFGIFDQGLVASLTESGWRIEAPATFDVEGLPELLDSYASPSDFGPSDGDPMAAAIAKVARTLGGTFELADLPAPPAGTIY